MADQWAVPVSDVATGGWKNQVASAVLSPSIDEAYAAVDDADYIISEAVPANDTCRVSLSPIVAPSAGTVRLWIRARIGRNAGTPFIWDAVSGATSYVLQISNDGGVTWTVFNSNVGNVVTYTVALLPGTYTSRVVPYIGATPQTPTNLGSVTV